MKRERVEDKAAANVEYDGRAYTKSDFSDDGRTVRAGTALSDGLWDVARRLGLTYWDGRPIQTFIVPTPDPLEPRREEAPPEILEAIAVAAAGLEEVRTRNAASMDRLRTAAQKREGSRIVILSRDEVGHLEQEELLAARRVSEAESQLRHWLDDERLRRREKAYPSQPGRLARTVQTISRAMF